MKILHGLVVIATEKWDGNPSEVDNIIAKCVDGDRLIAISMEYEPLPEQILSKYSDVREFGFDIFLDDAENTISEHLWSFAKEITNELNKRSTAWDWKISSVSWRAVARTKDMFHSVFSFKVTPRKENEDKSGKPIGKNHLFTSGGKLYGGRSVFDANH